MSETNAEAATPCALVPPSESHLTTSVATTTTATTTANDEATVLSLKIRPLIRTKRQPTQVQTCPAASYRETRYTLGSEIEAEVLHPSGQVKLVQSLLRAASLNSSDAVSSGEVGTTDATTPRIFTHCGYEIESGTKQLVNGDALILSPDGVDIRDVDGGEIMTESTPSSTLKNLDTMADSASIASALPLLFHLRWSTPRWFSGLKHHEDLLLSIFSFLFPSQALPQMVRAPLHFFAAPTTMRAANCKHSNLCVRFS